MPEAEDLEPVQRHPSKRARIKKHAAPLPETSVATPVTYSSLTGPAKRSNRERKALAPDSAEPLDSHALKRSRIKGRVISPFETLIGAPLPSALLAGPKSDKTLKRKKPEGDSAEPFDILPIKRAHVESNENVRHQASPGVHSHSTVLVAARDGRQISQPDTGQSEMAVFTTLITDLFLTTDIVYISEPSKSFVGDHIQSRKRKMSEPSPLDLLSDAPRRKIARSATPTTLHAPLALAAMHAKHSQHSCNLF